MSTHTYLRHKYHLITSLLPINYDWMTITHGTLEWQPPISSQCKSQKLKSYIRKNYSWCHRKASFKFCEVENSRKAFQEMRAIIYKYYPFQKWGEKKTHKYYLVEKHVNSLHIFSQANTSVPTENTSF